jgi:hypothetical protein
LADQYGVDSSIKKLDEMDKSPFKLNGATREIPSLNRGRRFGDLGRNRHLVLLAEEPAMMISGWCFAYAFPIPTHRPDF